MNLGTDLGGAGAPVPPPAAPRRRRTLIAVIVITALAGASAAVVALTSRSTPADTVERYLTALLERDVAAALDEVDLSYVPYGDKQWSMFLDEAAMRTDWSFGSIDAEPFGEGWLHRERVTVELSGFGQTGEAVFAVDKIGDVWRIANPFARVSFTYSSLAFFDVDGVHLANSDLETNNQWPEFPVFPGTHRFFERLPEGVALSSPEDYDMLLLPSVEGEDDAVAPVPEMTLGGELADRARQQIDGIIDVCAASSEIYPPVHEGGDFTQYCPFGLVGQERLGDGRTAYMEGPVEWSVTEYPVFALVDPPEAAETNQLLYGGFRAVVEEPGTISAAAVSIDVYEEGVAEPEQFTAVFECEFAPEGFRGRLTEDGMLPMYFLSVSGESMRTRLTVVGLDVDGCTHLLEAR
ncbi:MAG TPA: hypothetical protein VFU12_20805 [Glycomyces sp.]|nr:hypothetical protein [Glycomyces sp.]